MSVPSVRLHLPGHHWFDLLGLFPTNRRRVLWDQQPVRPPVVPNLRRCDWGWCPVRPPVVPNLRRLEAERKETKRGGRPVRGRVPLEDLRSVPSQPGHAVGRSGPGRKISAAGVGRPLSTDAWRLTGLGLMGRTDWSRQNGPMGWGSSGKALFLDS